MSARGFGSVLSAGAVVGAALGFYLVSLRVASERAALEDVETKIALTQRDIRLLQTEIGTRGRLAQLERWNVKFIRLSAPNADQFVDGGFKLATLVAPPKRPAIDAPVVLAAASIPPSDGRPKLTGDIDEPSASPSQPISEMMHVASYSVPRPKAPEPKPLKLITPKVEAVTLQPTAKAASATKAVKTATADPLAPLSGSAAKAKGSTHSASAGGASLKTSKARVTD